MSIHLGLNHDDDDDDDDDEDEDEDEAEKKEVIQYFNADGIAVDLVVVVAVVVVVVPKNAQVDNAERSAEAAYVEAVETKRVLGICDF